jgi:hypothetical protein
MQIGRMATNWNDINDKEENLKGSSSSNSAAKSLSISAELLWTCSDCVFLKKLGMICGIMYDAQVLPIADIFCKVE